MEKFFNIIAEEMNLKPHQVRNTVGLLDDGNTVPFVARYRKEVTGSLDEEQIRLIGEKITYIRNLQARKETILKTIDEQGKLTPELKKKIESADSLQLLEDLYLPYKPKKRTRATIAREKGLEPLARAILNGELTEANFREISHAYLNEEKGISDETEALSGAKDIIAETISDTAELRTKIRENTRKNALLETSLTEIDSDSSEFKMYEDFSEPIAKMPPHRVLAINRGENLKKLKVSLECDSEPHLNYIFSAFAKTDSDFSNRLIREAGEDAYKRLIFPSIEREVRKELTEKADEHAITVFATNLKQLLLQPPMTGKRILGIDPGFRTGCKIAAIDETGRYLFGETIYPHPPHNKVFESKAILRGAIEEYNIDIIAIGNGTASRETEQLVSGLIAEMKEDKPDLSYIIVNEAGASIYSASAVAREEFPELEASLRGNISIARRLLDPLAELVKIEPKHIGVGLYQHDVNQKALHNALEAVIESAVNTVGVDLNTASPSLLKYVSGLTSRMAKNIVEYRDKKGKFLNREELKKVAGIGEMAFQQAAGFLRIRNGDNVLDNTAIHPESYEATRKILAGLQIDNLQEDSGKLVEKLDKVDPVSLAREVDLGLPTLLDIIDNLKRPGRDPREDMPKPILKSDVLSIDDLKEGMTLQGTVRNVVDFGAFVDIGLKNDGLVHISQLADKYVKNPHEIVSVGQIVSVRVISIDRKRGRIGLSMKKGN